MRVTLIFPAVGHKAGHRYVKAWQMQPLSMAVLAGLMPPSVELRFYDDRIEPIPYDEPTDLVAISVETFTALRAYRIARRFRARGVPVVLGGYHVTLCPEEAALEADAIVRGDAESVWARLLDDARHGRLQTVYQGPRRRGLPGVRTRREIFRDKAYQKITLVEFARGCNFECDFCSITAYHQASQSHRPPEEVADEMVATGSRRFFIVDDNIVSQPAMARRLCHAIAPLGIHWVGQASIHVAQDRDLLKLMVESGCRGVLIGMESIDPDNLRTMGKGWNLAGGDYAASLRRFREQGLAVYGTFVFGYDNDDRQVIRRSVEFAREQQLFLAAFNHLVPFPGTPLYQRLLREGRLLSEKWWLEDSGRIGEVTFWPRKLEPEELEELCLDARRQFYSWSSIWHRLREPQANARNLLMLGIYLGLNLQSHFDIDLRQGLRLGQSMFDEESHEPVSV